ncbi:hypothetical protein T265_09538, partial [Opisthorchis viverrini]
CQRYCPVKSSPIWSWATWARHKLGEMRRRDPQSFALMQWLRKSHHPLTFWSWNSSPISQMGRGLEWQC